MACRAIETMMINGKCFKMTVPWIWTCPLHWTGANLWCSPERSQSAVSGPWSPEGRYLHERSPCWSCQEYHGSVFLKCLKICRYVCRFVHKVHLWLKQWNWHIYKLFQFFRVITKHIQSKCIDLMLPWCSPITTNRTRFIIKKTKLEWVRVCSSVLLRV